MARSRTVYWTPFEGPGCEQLHLHLAPEGTRALGLILRGREGQHFRCRYELSIDAGFRCRRLDFAVSLDVDGTARRVVMESDGAGDWRVDGEPAPALDGCLDIDIQVTPFTNTLPIRRLGLAAGESREIRVAYLPVPALQPRAVEQRYTCLVPLGPAGGRYRYEGLFRGFTADLAVDADGLVLDYPETFARSWPR